MTTLEFVQPAIPKFDGHYDFWAMTMENFLRSKELWSLVEVGIPTLVIGSGSSGEAHKGIVEAAKLNDLKVKNFLFQSIDRKILETILDKSTSRAIWNSMKQKYQGSTRVKRAQLQALRKEFKLLTMKEGEKVDTFLGRTMSIVSKMKSNEEAVEQSVVRKNMSSKQLMSTLVAEAVKRRSLAEAKAVVGLECHRLGHFQYECPDWDNKANYAEFNDEEEILLMAHEEQQMQEDERWYFDSGCSNHMTRNKTWFLNLEEEHSKTVKLGNDTHMTVAAKGSIQIHVNGITQKPVKLIYGTLVLPT
ncbi:uncharacterized protein LOC106763306 [Vigna radiata var. radiata]|uniref:Uncharacterized protein LOC106763306 n=1 Tax=Vigna radiata var. radiata TaxID=3916 RepID=A0A1S3UAD7_VIGRR|nr:uncharacterized protein LOC106763306 [Vigna radiata var. radiata]